MYAALQLRRQVEPSQDSVWTSGTSLCMGPAAGLADVAEKSRHFDGSSARVHAMRSFRRRIPCSQRVFMRGSRPVDTEPIRGPPRRLACDACFEGLDHRIGNLTHIAAERPRLFMLTRSCRNGGGDSRRLRLPSSLRLH